MALFRENVLEVYRKLEKLATGTFESGFLIDGLILDRRARYVEFSRDTPLLKSSEDQHKKGVVATDPFLKDRCFGEICELDLSQHDKPPVPFRLIEGIPGSGKTAFLEFARRCILNRIQNSNADKVLVTPVINTLGIHATLGNHLTDFYWKIMAELDRFFREQYPDDFVQYRKRPAHGPQQRLRHCLDVYHSVGDIPEGEDRNYINVSALVDFLRSLWKQAHFKTVILLDEVSSFFKKLTPAEKTSFTLGLFTSFPDETNDINVILLISVLDGEADDLLTLEGRSDTGAVRRAANRRIYLGNFTDQEKLDAIAAVIDNYFAKLIDVPQASKEAARQLCDVIGTNTPSEVIKAATIELLEKWQVHKEKLLKDWEIYQGRTKQPFLDKARQMGRSLKGSPEIDENTYQSEKQKGSHSFDHYVEATLVGSRIYFYGESSLTRLGLTKYKHGFFPFRDVLPALGQHEFVVLIAPGITPDAEKQALADGMTFLEVADNRKPPAPPSGKLSDFIVKNVPAGQTPKGKPRGIRLLTLSGLCKKNFPSVTDEEILATIDKDPRLERQGKTCYGRR